MTRRPSKSPGRAPPIDAPTLDRLALRYVERYATTRAKLVAYLDRKLAERGWADARPDPVALVDRLADLGYVDDRAYGEAKATAMARRGLGARRVDAALWHAGVRGEDAEDIAPVIAGQAVESALRFARRRRFGPFADTRAEGAVRERQFAAMLRAGHAPEIIGRILRMAPGEDTQTLFGTE